MTSKAIVRKFFEISNELQASKGDVAELDQLFHANFIQHIGQYPAINLTAFKDMATASNKAFSNASITIKELVAEDGKVTAYVVWQGIHTGEIWNIPATQKIISTQAMHLFHIKEDKIAELWSVSDASAMKRQLASTE